MHSTYAPTEPQSAQAPLHTRSSQEGPPGDGMMTDTEDGEKRSRGVPILTSAVGGGVPAHGWSYPPVPCVWPGSCSDCGRCVSAGCETCGSHSAGGGGSGGGSMALSTAAVVTFDNRTWEYTPYSATADWPSSSDHRLSSQAVFSRQQHHSPTHPLLHGNVTDVQWLPVISPPKLYPGFNLDLSIRITYPNTPHNLQTSPVMLTLELFSSNRSRLARATRAHVVHTQYPFVQVARAAAVAVPVLLGVWDDSTTVKMLCIEGFPYESEDQLSYAYVSMSPLLHVSRAELLLETHLTGFRWWMREWPFFCMFIFVSATTLACGLCFCCCCSALYVFALSQFSHSSRHHRPQRDSFPEVSAADRDSLRYSYRFDPQKKFPMGSPPLHPSTAPGPAGMAMVHGGPHSQLNRPSAPGLHLPTYHVSDLYPASGWTSSSLQVPSSEARRSSSWGSSVRRRVSGPPGSSGGYVSEAPVYVSAENSRSDERSWSI
eukprot:GHVQ01015035.1.p1 GENE.GHVQ01015035.1~~GHVQ01015035.1.p1  ORF type:complete len:559 (-),score=92.35 GHVQ01015035.1:217-1677(-)